MRRTDTPSIIPSEITPEKLWLTRREWLQRAGLGALAASAGTLIPKQAKSAPDTTKRPALPASRNTAYSVDDPLTSEADVTSYNNFFEFGTDKDDPQRYAHRMQTEPWAVRVEGEVERPGTYDIDTLRTLADMEERIYRLRCVEGWSMVIPWTGYSLAALLKHVQPTSSAKYVEFETALQPENMPGVKGRILDWPYTEGLRLDEAMHPLTLLVFGVYGKALPNQNGAPLRVAVPWKYGFKSAKSIVAIRLLKEAPVSSWTKAAAQEYGFFANVNPNVPHPRWSQATERRIGAGFFAPRVDTQLFNGYADQVAHLYDGMDLARFY